MATCRDIQLVDKDSFNPMRLVINRYGHYGNDADPRPSTLTSCYTRTSCTF